MERLHTAEELLRSKQQEISETTVTLADLRRKEAEDSKTSEELLKNLDTALDEKRSLVANLVAHIRRTNEECRNKALELQRVEGQLDEAQLAAAKAEEEFTTMQLCSEGLDDRLKELTTELDSYDRQEDELHHSEEKLQIERDEAVLRADSLAKLIEDEGAHVRNLQALLVDFEGDANSIDATNRKIREMENSLQSETKRTVREHEVLKEFLIKKLKLSPTASPDRGTPSGTGFQQLGILDPRTPPRLIQKAPRFVGGRLVATPPHH
jgi:chromosome segregation ATPase